MSKAEYSMNEETEKWVRKAEGDFVAAQTLLKKRSAITAHMIVSLANSQLKNT